MSNESITITCQVDEILKILGINRATAPAGAIITHNLDDFAIGEYVIIRTYSAGVWFGKLDRKAGKEVILTEARRMWYWQCKESISLSGIVAYGIDRNRSRIAAPLDKVWLEAIEILPIKGEAMESIKGAEIAESE